MYTCSIVNVSVLDSLGPVDCISFSGEGDAPEKVRESDWYHEGTDGPPYKKIYGDEENTDDSPDMFDDGIYLPLGME